MDKAEIFPSRLYHPMQRPPQEVAAKGPHERPEYFQVQIQESTVWKAIFWAHMHAACKRIRLLSQYHQDRPWSAYSPAAFGHMPEATRCSGRKGCIVASAYCTKRVWQFWSEEREMACIMSLIIQLYVHVYIW